MRHQAVGLCEPGSPARIDPECFFAKDNAPERATAIALCNSCPLQDKCVEMSLRLGVTDGIWGGLGPADREKVWKQWPNGRPATFCDDYDRQIRQLQRERREREAWTERESA